MNFNPSVPTNRGKLISSPRTRDIYIYIYLRSISPKVFHGLERFRRCLGIDPEPLLSSATTLAFEEFKFFKINISRNNFFPILVQISDGQNRLLRTVGRRKIQGNVSIRSWRLESGAKTRRGESKKFGVTPKQIVFISDRLMVAKQ